LTPPCLTFEPPATAALFFRVPFRVSSPHHTPRGRDAKYHQPQIVRRPCSKSWPASNYVCTFSLQVLDMDVTKGNPASSPVGWAQDQEISVFVL